MLSTDDVVERDGVLVTTPLRTACDALRLLHRDQAIAVSDMLTSVGAFEVERVSQELERFKGYRGVIQARALAPLIDRGSGSPGESIVRMRWYDAGLPRPTCQVEVEAPRGSYFIDLGLPGMKFGAEYFGEEFHGPDEAERDRSRLAWIRDVEGWTIVVIRKDNLFGPKQNAEQQLRSAYRRLLGG